MSKAALSIFLRLCAVAAVAVLVAMPREAEAFDPIIGACCDNSVDQLGNHLHALPGITDLCPTITNYCPNRAYQCAHTATCADGCHVGTRKGYWCEESHLAC